MKYLELLQGALLRELGKAISVHNEKFNTESCTPEDVFANIEYIYEEIAEMEFGSPTGRTMKFMPKRYKEMVMRLVSPECTFSYKKMEGETAVSIDAYLFLNREDTKPIATGSSTVSFNALSNPDLDDFSKKRMVEAIAKGQAESKALQKFGIGSWFKYELEEESPEVLLEQAKQRADLSPTAVPVQNVQKVDMSSISEETTEPVTEPAVEEMKPEPVLTPVLTDEEPEQKTKKASKPKTEEPASAQPMIDENLEAARAVVCTVGKAKGMTLGEIEAKFAANLVWQFSQPDCNYKESLRVIIANNSELKSYAEERGVQI